MVNLPAFTSVPTFGSAAAKTQPDTSTYVGGYVPGQVFPAEHENWFMAGLTANGVASNTALYATVEELDNFLGIAGVTPASGVTDQIATVINSPVGLGIAAMGMTVDYTDWYQLDRHIIARSHLVGETFASEIVETQVIVSDSRSSANPSFPDYNPVISRSVDKVITSAMAPLLVAKLRAYKASFLGVQNFTGTVSGSNVTFALTAASSAMLNALIQEALVRRWFSTGQNKDYALSGGDYTGMTITVNGVEYPLVSANASTGVVTVTGSPTTGAQTCNLYPYRITGSSSSIQLPRLSGFVPVGADDADGVEVNGYRHMDQAQTHWHSQQTNAYSAAAGSNPYRVALGANVDNGPIGPTGPAIDGGAGTPRSGKNNNPRSSAKNYYTWAGDLRAAA